MVSSLDSVAVVQVIEMLQRAALEHFPSDLCELGYAPGSLEPFKMRIV